LFLQWAIKNGMSDVLDFGSGLECRYCDILETAPLVFHVDFQAKRQMQCVYSDLNMECTAQIYPVCVDYDYKSVLCLNSLQNNSPWEIYSLMQKWRHKKIFATWPVDYKSDETDPYLIMSQEVRCWKYGYLEDFVYVPDSHKKSIRVFFSDPEMDLSPQNISSLSGWRPSERDDNGPVSAFVIGLYRGEIIGNMRKFRANTKEYQWFDFLAGGKVHYGELVPDALTREIDEELVDANLKPKFFGYSEANFSHGFVHYYYHVFESEEYQGPNGRTLKRLQLPEGRVGRHKDGSAGRTQIISQYGVIRDDMVPALEMLVHHGLISPGYAESLIRRWQMVQIQMTKRGVIEAIIDQAYEKHLADKKTPVHNYLKQRKRCADRRQRIVRETKVTFHYVTYRPLKVNQIVILTHKIDQGAHVIYYAGREHARFSMISPFIGKVDQIVRAFDGFYDTSNIIGRTYVESYFFYFSCDMLSRLYFRHILKKYNMIDFNERMNDEAIDEFFRSVGFCVDVRRVQLHLGVGMFLGKYD